jgi:hypothetical protein
METSPPALRIDQLPLWRLLVALSDAERVAGAKSPTARALASEINRRLSGLSESHVATVRRKGAGRD